MGLSRGVDLEKCSFMGFGVPDQSCDIVGAQQCSGENTWGRKPVRVNGSNMVEAITSTNGKSAIAFEESVICSRWELSNDMFVGSLRALDREG